MDCNWAVGIQLTGAPGGKGHCKAGGDLKHWGRQGLPGGPRPRPP